MDYVFQSCFFPFRDIVTKVVCPSAFGWELRVEDIMAKNVTTCSPDSIVLEVVKTMKNKHLRRIPVINAKNLLVGLVTNFDLASVRTRPRVKLQALAFDFIFWRISLCI